MLSIYDNGPYLPCPSNFNMAAHVLRHADTVPDKIALAVLGLSGAERYSYARIKSAVLGTATGLLNAGMAPGDILLMRLGNTVDFPITYLGAIAAGIVPVPTSSQLTERETASMIATLSPRAIVRADGIACADGQGALMFDLDQMRAMHDLPPAAFDMGDPDRLAYIIYTSGTSGTPRAVMHAHRAIWARQMMVDGWYGLTSDDRLLHAGAFNWTYTLGTGLMDPWAIGATALIPQDGIDMSALPLLLSRHDATIFAAAPGVYRKVLTSGKPLSLPKLRHGLAAGEKLPQKIRDDWQAATGTQIFEAYGMSECSTFISNAPSTAAAEHRLGWPQVGRRVAIVGADGPVPIGTEGTIAVSNRDPGLMIGYYGAPDETAARYHGEWFMTGDQGVMDETYGITYLARSDDMMNAGGYRVSPIEVESVLQTHPQIQEVGVIDVAIKEGVTVIAAFYVAADDIPPEDLSAFAEERLARYKQPRMYHRIAQLPRNANNKVLRQVLRKEYEATL